jgi:hypothetical protein
MAADNARPLDIRGADGAALLDWRSSPAAPIGPPTVIGYRVSIDGQLFELPVGDVQPIYKDRA